MSEPTRLSKRVIALTGCSRREAELYIEGGWVLVDGVAVDEPQYKVDEAQRVELAPGARAEPLPPVTLLLNKPAGIPPEQAAGLLRAESLSQDPGVPPTRPLRRHFTRLSMPLPLEPQASGLLVLTQDWQVMRRLSDDAATIEQEYVVGVTGSLGAEGLAELNRAPPVNGWPLPAVKVSWQNETHLRFAGKMLGPQQIRERCAAVGLSAAAIRRIRIGSVALSKLPAGHWRYLPAFKRF